jgi:glycosyltransferase involved in cell wall biosynthesis
MKVALIHDHLAQDGGAEKVLQVLMEIYPDAPIYTLLCEKNIEEKHYKDRTIFTSIIQRLPGGVKLYQWYLPLMPMAVEFFDLTDYDLVISDTSSFAKGVITPPNTLHVCYCHTPTRYLWSDTHEYIRELKYNKFFKKIISLILNYVRLWDRAAADRVDEYIANSETVAKRIKKYYKHDSIVINPPVEVNRFEISHKNGNEDYFLTGCRLTPYKRIDLVVEAFKKNGKNLKIFGSGPDMKRLKKIAGEAENIEFLGRVSDEQLKKLYSGCSAFLNPQEEDFGITCVEAMASGRPVIAYRAGGARETIIENKTGIFFDAQNVNSLNQAIDKYYDIEFNPKEIKEHADQFSKESFKKQIKDFIAKKYNEFRDH